MSCFHLKYEPYNGVYLGSSKLIDKKEGNAHVVFNTHMHLIQMSNYGNGSRMCFSIFIYF